jgi:TonB family protein
LNPSSMALSEVVVVGYGSRNADYKEDIEPESYTPPKPLTGQTAFDKYIESNIRRPDTLTAGQRAVVVISFTVKTDGTQDNYKIIRSPAKQFSDEALRLIKEGPEWKPAKKNGTDVEEDVRLRIVFK